LEIKNKDLIDMIKDLFASLTKKPLPLAISIQWLDSILKDVWGFASSFLTPEFVLSAVRAKIPKKFVDIELDPFTLGNQPPTITNWDMSKRIIMTHVGEKEYIHFVVKLKWQSDVDIGIYMMKRWAHVGIRSITVTAELHVCFSDLIDKPPFITGISIYLVKPISFNMDFVGALDFLDSDVIQNLIHNEVDHIVAEKAQLPNRIPIIIDKDAKLRDLFLVAAPVPKGILKFTPYKATGLRGDDLSFSTLWTGKRTADPYIIMELGADKFRTSTQFNESTGEAAWDDESYYFLVYEPLDQTFRCTVFDDDHVSGDEPLAERRHIFTHELLNLPDGKAETLTKPTQYKFRMQLEPMWPDKCKPGGTVEEHKKELLKKNGVDEDDHHSFFQRFKDFAKEGYAETKKVLHDVEHKLEEAIKDNTGMSDEDLKRLDSQLELKTEWFPIELNSAASKTAAPGVSTELVNTLLYIGVYKLHSVKHPVNVHEHDDEEFSYWAEVECFPHINKHGVVEEEVKQEKKEEVKLLQTEHKHIDKKDSKKDKEEKEDKEKEDDLERKMVICVQAGMDFDKIADVLDIDVAKVENFLSSADLPMEHDCDVTWLKGFSLLLNDPRKTIVNITVKKQQKGLFSGPKEVGKYQYRVEQLLSCQGCYHEVLKAPLSGENVSNAKLTLQFQLFNIVTGQRNASRSLQREVLPPALTEKPKPGEKPKKITVYSDILGRQKIMVNGMWVEDNPLETQEEKDKKAKEKKDSEKKESTVEKVEEAAASAAHAVGGALVSAEHAVEGAFHKVADFFHHKDKDEEGAPATRDVADTGEQSEGFFSRAKHSMAHAMHLDGEAAPAADAPATDAAAAEAPAEKEGFFSRAKHSMAHAMHLDGEAAPATDAPATDTPVVASATDAPMAAARSIDEIALAAQAIDNTPAAPAPAVEAPAEKESFFMRAKHSMAHAMHLDGETSPSKEAPADDALASETTAPAAAASAPRDLQPVSPPKEEPSSPKEGFFSRAKHSMAHALHLDGEAPAPEAAAPAPPASTVIEPSPPGDVLGWAKQATPPQEAAPPPKEEPAHREGFFSRAKHSMAHALHLDGESPEKKTEEATTAAAAPASEEKVKLTGAAARLAGAGFQVSQPEEAKLEEPKAEPVKPMSPQPLNERPISLSGSGSYNTGLRPPVSTATYLAPSTANAYASSGSAYATTAATPVSTYSPYTAATTLPPPRSAYSPGYSTSAYSRPS